MVRVSRVVHEAGAPDSSCIMSCYMDYILTNARFEQRFKLLFLRSAVVPGVRKPQSTAIITRLSHNATRTADRRPLTRPSLGVPLRRRGPRRNNASNNMCLRGRTRQRWWRGLPSDAASGYSCEVINDDNNRH